MKDEELAEQYAQNLEKELMKEYEEHPEYGQTPYLATIPTPHAKQAFLAGLKAGRPQWHNLRENPNDLPKDTVSVLISRGTPRTSRARYNGKWYGYYSDDEIEDVIAWCEIPTFDKE